MSLDPHAVATWVARTCHAQGVPVKVEDAAVLRGVAVLLSAGTGVGPSAGGEAAGLCAAARGPMPRPSSLVRAVLARRDAAITGGMQQGGPSASIA